MESVNDVEIAIQIFYARYWEIYFAIRELSIDCCPQALAHVAPMSDIYAVIFAFDDKDYDG